jgi:inorganic pyrophosphatase
VLNRTTASEPQINAQSRDGVTPMLEYELYVPLHHNDGRPVDPNMLRDLKKRLVDEFGGLTHLRQENDGFWKIGEHTFRDRIEILRVLANDSERVHAYFRDLKVYLKREWNQQHFLIVARQVTAV